MCQDRHALTQHQAITLFILDTKHIEVLKLAKHVTEMKPDYTQAMDIRGEPTTVCPCGCNIWNVKTMFSDDGEIDMYFLDMECAECGTLATAPTPIDTEESYD
jgi:hypothetical protein